MLVGNEEETRMSVLRSVCVAVLFVVCGLLANAHAAVVYSEGPDLSGEGNAPTPVNVTIGHNEIDGMTGNGDKDYFKIVVPDNARLDSLSVLPGTTILGNVSFIAIGAGDIQDFNPGTATYHFDLVLTAVPEPDAYVAMLFGLALLALGWRRRVGL
jgi:hypothetical protein